MSVGLEAFKNQRVVKNPDDQKTIQCPQEPKSLEELSCYQEFRALQKLGDQELAERLIKIQNFACTTRDTARNSPSGCKTESVAF